MKMSCHGFRSQDSVSTYPKLPQPIDSGWGSKVVRCDTSHLAPIYALLAAETGLHYTSPVGHQALIDL